MSNIFSEYEHSRSNNKLDYLGTFDLRILVINNVGYEVIFEI